MWNVLGRLADDEHHAMPCSPALILSPPLQIGMGGGEGVIAITPGWVASTDSISSSTRRAEHGRVRAEPTLPHD